MALTTTHIPELNLVARGKVRDIYATNDTEALLFVATDRISAYDVILNNGVPGKGRILTQLSLFWFEKLAGVIPNHLITANVEDMPDEIKAHRDQLEGRAMLVKRARVIPLEAIVRGFLTGSAWKEYQTSQTVHGIQLPPGLIESSRLPQPLFTPSTKAEQGAHDENIHPDVASSLIGAELYGQLSEVAVKLYVIAATYAEGRGLILADTKFEFGLVGTENTGGERLILIDEVLTPDSSRYWPLEGYQPGKPQPSFDKQFLRDWLSAQGFKKGLETGKIGQTGWTMDGAVVEGTKKRYEEALHLLVP